MSIDNKTPIDDDLLHSLYKQSATELPSRKLDDTISTYASANINEPVNKEPVAPKSAWRRWQVPVSLAATFCFVAVLFIREQPEFAQLSDEFSGADMAAPAMPDSVQREAPLSKEATSNVVQKPLPLRQSLMPSTAIAESAAPSQAERADFEKRMKETRMQAMQEKSASEQSKAERSAVQNNEQMPRLASRADSEVDALGSEDTETITVSGARVSETELSIDDERGLVIEIFEEWQTGQSAYPNEYTFAELEQELIEQTELFIKRFGVDTLPDDIKAWWADRPK